MKNLPLVSVLMPAYNRAQYISEAIESIIAQTYPNWELIIVDDGSTDHTTEIIKKYQRQDKRIILHQFSENKGIPYARNKCLELAKGKYLANLDSDDIALPKRLEKQVTFMEENPEIGVCGGQAYHFDGQGNKLPQPFLVPLNDEDIKFNILFHVAWFHNPSVIFHKELLSLFEYDLDYLYAQDLKLWVDLFQKAEFVNLKDFIVAYRQHGKQVSYSQRVLQKKLTRKATHILLYKLWNAISEDEVEFHLDLIHKEKAFTIKYLKEVNEWYRQLIRYNYQDKIFSDFFFEKRMSEQWLKDCLKHTSLGLQVWLIYQTSGLKCYKIGYRNQLQFFLDCLFKRESKYVK